MNETIVMNATGYGLTGLTNLSMQGGAIGTILGATLVVGLILGVFASMHSWNSKGRLYKIFVWLLRNLGENVVYGGATVSIVGAIYYIGDELSKFGASNPNILQDIAWYSVLFVGGIALLAIIGYATKPIYQFAYDYATARPKKVVR